MKNDSNRIIIAGKLKIKGWHNKACEVLDTGGVSTCIHCQSNNLLQKIMDIQEPLSCAVRARSDGDWRESSHKQKLEIRGEYSNSLTSVAKDSYVIEPCIFRPKRTEEEKRRRHSEGDTGAKFASKYMEPINDGCSNTISTITKDNILMENQKIKDKPEGKGWLWSEEKQKWVKYRIRKLTARECFRLMGVRDTDTDKIKSAGISESQQYKMAGNSIVVDVMYYIFKNLFTDTEKPADTLF